MLAASRADAPVISALLDAGANPNIRASKEFGLSFYIKVKNPSPLDLVTFSEHNNISDSLKILLSPGADPSQTFLKLGACRKGDIELYAWADKLKPRKISLTVARVAKVLEIQGFTSYFSFIRTPRALPSGRSHPTSEVKMFCKVLKIQCI